MSARQANDISIQTCDDRKTFDLPPVIEYNNVPNDRSEIATLDIAIQYVNPHLIASRT